MQDNTPSKVDAARGVEAAASVADTPADATPPSAPAARKRGVMRHASSIAAGGVNAVAAVGICVATLSYVERPWLILERSVATVAAAGGTTTDRQASLTTASLPVDRVYRPAPVETATVDKAPADAIATHPAPTSPTVTVAPPQQLAQATAPPTTDAASPAPASNTPPSQPLPPAAAAPEPATQRPKANEREAQFIAAMDRLLEPTRGLNIAVEDATRIRDAFANPKDIPAVRALRDQAVDPVARKLIDWSLLRGGAGTAREVRNFLAENPDWPNRDLLNQRAEEYHFLAGGSAKDIKAFFADQEPRTAIGRAALASAMMAEGDNTTAAQLAAWAWRQGDIPVLLESGFIERFGKLLTEPDHKYRVDRLLADDSRWENERKERATLVRRTIAFLSEPERAKANARLAVYLRSPDANKLMAALPADAATKPQPDWGFALQLAQWHRRGGRWQDAWNIVKTVPTDTATLVSPDDWWEERRVSAYDALKAGRPQDAYDLVKSAGELGVNARKDQTFLAGWIAAKHLKDNAAAIRHFRELEATADGPLARGKAGWWLADLYEQAGDKANAKAHLEKAAKNIDTFYGMLARQKLSGGKTEFVVTPPQLPTAAEAKAFNNRDAVKALILTRRAGLDPSIARAFIANLRNTLQSEPEQAMIAHVAEAIGDTQMAVRVGKSAVARGLNLITYAYPIHPMPAYQPLRPPPEPAVLLGVARQESEFNTSTKSGAGATGLLQVMPITANHVCKDYRIKCDLPRLREPAYNAMMASAYIGDRMDEFTGSYVLTLAGYNAGPGRARQWIREFGDPRDPSADPIDWIHRIPFEETREYVLKVLSNIQIYRARLGNEAKALTLTTDLRRFAPSTKRAGAAASGG